MGNPIRVEPEEAAEEERHAQVYREIDYAFRTHLETYNDLLRSVVPNAAGWDRFFKAKNESTKAINALYNNELHLHRVHMELIGVRRVARCGLAGPVHTY